MKSIGKGLIGVFIGGLILGGVAILALYIRNLVFLGSSNEETVTYLNRNRTVVTDEIAPTFFEASFYDASIFLFGEIHGFADNQRIDRLLFEHLNREAGIRHYLAEIDSTVAGQLNNFLQADAKDTLLLKQVIRAISTTIPQQAGKQLYEKWLALYDYNRLLADSAKIEVIGIDKVATDTSAISREESMLTNLNNYISSHGLDSTKLYGFFGYYHVLQTPPKNTEPPLAAMLKAEGRGIRSLASFTLESMMYMPKGLGIPTPDDEQVSVVNANGPLMLVKGINDLKNASTKNTITLFRLDGTNSPYATSQRLSHIESTLIGADLVPQDDAQTQTLDYFQYVFFSTWIARYIAFVVIGYALPYFCAAK